MAWQYVFVRINLVA